MSLMAMAAEAAQFLPDSARSSTRPYDESGRLSVRDWIEEARLLLGGMKASTTSGQDPPGA